ncbi:mycofactocin biosynthesis peptidyl-dipeptidase MftE [Skermania piniformis]|uniref:Mycofactocin biosynthesis peptidyl-dipeptidase MftE n=1 Tax=Skermania pinensis TaxID=39122 RepID=A0ABX8S9J2_9ACTN|nr:mycofactocin biosynthesis peptidyl-dipeptidase MftE [Skermania piniformis]
MTGDRRAPQLADLTWPEIAGRPTVAVPLGSVEQHGPHLPLDTDTAIATAVARELPDTVTAPAIGYGSSGEHQGFPGTVSIGAEALTAVLLEYGRSIFHWAGRVVFVNGHGGNLAPLAAAVGRLRAEGRDAGWLPCAVAGADAHAGHTETAIMLHLAPDRVHADRLEQGNLAAIETLLPRLRVAGVAAVSANGVLGDPRSAGAAAGARLFHEMVAAAAAAVEVWAPRADGLLQVPPVSAPD